jgi:hypothetical protein
MSGGRWGGRASEKAGMRDFAGDAAPKVDQYVSLLEAHLGQSYPFENLVRQLENDPAVGPQEMVEIAKKFTGVGAGMSRGKALEQIKRRQRNLDIQRMKSESRMGRSAG